MRISASSYSNTAPLIWSFLYGSNHGMVEIILDNAPARSAELLSQDRVDAALVPVFAYQLIDRVKLVPDVCVGARERVRSVRLISKKNKLEHIRSVALDASSRTSIALTKIIFREFIGFDPEWRVTEPDVEKMLAGSDAALLIGDPALRIAECGLRNAEVTEDDGSSIKTIGENFGTSDSALRTSQSALISFDLAELWHRFTGLGFVFAMWMTRYDECPIDFARARDEGLEQVDSIIRNYEPEMPLERDEMRRYLTENISYSVDASMREGMRKYFELARKHQLIRFNKPLEYVS